MISEGRTSARRSKETRPQVSLCNDLIEPPVPCGSDTPSTNDAESPPLHTNKETTSNTTTTQHSHKTHLNHSVQKRKPRPLPTKGQQQQQRKLAQR
ncbi:hypothetical protein VNO78_32947 [Psophocarpus tetragonolobus]|uniref:Uncharacterized protein n=1 Tax=Psophocarpus tetragonolobus TaxID=3891 RepID=A0AAN9RPC8_PSOTE